MPRNASGIYSLPVAAYVAGTTIKSADMNTNLSDIATALTQSIATTGVSALTGPLKLAAGTVAAPSLTLASDTGTGWYNQVAGGMAFSSSGNQVFALATTGAAVTGTFSASGAATLGSAVITGGATIGGSLTVGTTLGVTGAATFNNTVGIVGKLSLTSTDSMAMANGTTGQRNGAPTAGDIRYNSTLSSMEYWNGTAWIVLGKAPTVQSFTTGAANYTPNTGVVRIRVRMCGGGGGGGGATANNGTAGNDSSFGTWTAIHGNAGVANDGAGGSGGTGGVNGTGTLIVRLDGGKGSSGWSGFVAGGVSYTSPGGIGGANPFGGSGAVTLNAAGSNGAVNTGAGGGGGGMSAASGSVNTGGGGGAGEYVEFWVNNPGVIAYSVGAAANGGAAGTFAGGNGAAGIIIIEEFYQ